MYKGGKEVHNVNPIEGPACETELGKDLNWDDAKKNVSGSFSGRINILLTRLIMNSFAPRSMARLQGLVPCPGRPIFFLGAANRIVGGNAVVVILSFHELPVVRCSGHVDAIVARILEDGAGQVVGVRPLERDL